MRSENCAERSRSRAWVEVDLSALRANVSAIAKFAGRPVSIMAVVKADAYGHGLVQTAQAALSAGCSWLGIAAVSEGAILRDAGITAPIALLSAPAIADAPDIVRYGLTAMAGDSAVLDALHKYRIFSDAELAVHLDIDTGMGRSGVLPEDAVKLWVHAASLGFAVRGASTHFADADGEDDCHTRHQIGQFKTALDALLVAGAEFDWVHIDNSASIVSGHDFECNLIRPGLLLYGISPKSHDRNQIPIRPALSLRARIAAVRELPAGHAISYGVLHRLSRKSRVATIPVGYGDGYPRALSNRGSIIVNGKMARILGSVCMDQTVVDVTDIPETAAGDEVICIGQQNGMSITVEQIAALTGAIEHEITTGLTARLPRVYLPLYSVIRYNSAVDGG